jgi:UDP:flavonoid glycosyltransferase YjiC (YdhE family)
MRKDGRVRRSGCGLCLAFHRVQADNLKEAVLTALRTMYEIGRSRKAKTFKSALLILRKRVVHLRHGR